MASSNDFQRHMPQHPLPEELRKMARDETICKYCGVSYLIHSEIKALEEKLRITEEELKKYRGAADREASLKEDVARYAASVDTYRKTLEDRDSVIKTVTAEIQTKNETIADLRKTKQVLEDKLLNEITENELNRGKLQNIQTILPTVHSSMIQFKEDINELKLQLIKLGKENLNDFKETVEKQKTVLEELSAEQSKLETENSKLSSENSRLLQVEISYQTNEKELKDTRTKLKSLEKKYDDLYNSEKRHKQEIEELKNCLENEKASTRLAESESQQYRHQLNVKVKEMETFAANKQNVEKNMETSVLVLQDKLKRKEVECKELQLERDELKRETSQRKEQQNILEAEIRRKAAVARDESEDLKESLSRVQDELVNLKCERESTIKQHQNQIEQLRDSFKKKLHDAENWREKVDEAVREERTKHSYQMESLEKKLRNEFETELQIEKQKHQELTDKYVKNTRDAETKFKAQLAQLQASHKSELGELHRQMSESRQRQKDTEDRLKTEIDSLKGIIKDLEVRLARLGTGNEDKITELKRESREKEGRIETLTSELSVLDKRIQELTEQLSLLQDTVRRECEERFELTEALSAAKEELLTLKRPTGGYSSATTPRLSLVHGDSRRHSLNSINQSQTSLQKPQPIREAFTANEAVIGGDEIRPTNQKQFNGASVSEVRKRIAAAMGRR